MEELLRAQWRAAVGPAVDEARSDDAFIRLMARYKEPHRRYHTVSHLAVALSTAEELLTEVPVGDPAAVRLALFFHDAIYDPAADGNEAASAALARNELGALGLPAARIDAVAALVEATAGHRLPGGEAGALSAEAGVVLDADLAVLAARPAQYSAYVAGVRGEYAHVDATGWESGRAAVLRALLARDALYRTAPMQSHEPRARANVAAELAALEAAAR